MHEYIMKIRKACLEKVKPFKLAWASSSFLLRPAVPLSIWSCTAVIIPQSSSGSTRSVMLRMFSLEA